MRAPADAPLLPIHERAEQDALGYGIYVHFPWCRSRCLYCAFNVRVEAEPRMRDWAEGIRAEWALRAPSFAVGPGAGAVSADAGAGPSSPRAHSLYFGGGTPSLAPPGLIEGLVRHFPLEPEAERTLEVNPGTVDRARLEAFLAAGIDRLSVGVQTFHPGHARRLGRGHGRAEVEALLALLPSLPLRSWSFDLIFALPDQTLAELDHDLDQLLAVAPPHVSLYGLSYEPGTPLRRALDAGALQPTDPELWADMYARIGERLGVAGYERYEVSNFALPGHRARHNEAVWRGGRYAGLGPGAHGFLPSGVRTVNHDGLDAWLADPGGATERPTAEEAAQDLLLSTLRHADGLRLDRLAAETGHGLRPEAVAPLLRGGALLQQGERLRIAPAAFPLADGVVRRLAQGLRPLPPASPAPEDRPARDLRLPF